MKNYATQYIGKTVSVMIDRPIGSQHPKYGFEYEINYGFISDTKAPDGKEIDAYVLEIDYPMKEFKGKCVAVIHRTNDDDDKLVVVSEGSEVSDEQIRTATGFQEQFFKSEIIR